MRTYYYHIYNLKLESEIELPEIPELSWEKDTMADVRIRFGELPDHLENIKSSGVLYEISGGDFLLKLPTIGKYLASNGREIIIDPKQGATDDEVRLFLLGSVMGAILHQRGYLPMHGSSVNINNEAVVIIGNSASGKSTLAAALNLKGYSLVSDDLSVISLNASGSCIIHPGIPSVKLWKDVTELLHPNNDLKRVRPQIQKFRVTVQSTHPLAENLAVKKIILLTTKNEPGFDLSEISGANKLKILRENIYRDQVIKGLGLMENHFRLLSKLSNQSELYHIKRPSMPLLIDELTEYIIQRIL